ncbi:Ileal sodium/bile acid cotransporter [Trichostrongylus colubriformis]|uniref:Ileal sodium/bile acid cotransporter n=1 Tax=Trichostrongylus colubriformis TaxID=6319 RepID=A0AAN8J0V2_TRICO
MYLVRWVTKSFMGRGVVINRRRCPLVLLVNLLLQVCISAASNLHDLAKSAVITFDPPFIHDLVEGHNRTVSVSVDIPPAVFASTPSDETYRLSIGSFHPDIAASPTYSDITKSSFVYDNESRLYKVDTAVVVHGNSLGKTGLRVRLVRAENWSDVDESWKVPEKLDDTQHNLLDVWVRRSMDSERWTHIFIASVVILITVGNVLMGCELDMSAVYDTVRRPIAPAIGFAAQFVIMPLLAYGIAKTVFVSRGLFSLALGLFITGCSPGGGASNFWTLLLDGNVNLSVTMTFLSTLASLAMMPFWISLLGKEFLQGFSADFKILIPYAKITRSLVTLVVPLLVGIAIKKWKPEWAAKSRKVMRPFIIFVLIFVIVFGALTNLYMFKMMTVPALLGGLLLPWCGFMFGCFVSIIFRRPPPDVTAIAIETGIQNTGIAILVLKASFSQPDADIGAVIPVIAACFTPGPLLLGAAVHLALKRLKKRPLPMEEIKGKTSGAQEPEEVPSSMSLLQHPSGDPGRANNAAAIATIA